MTTKNRNMKNTGPVSAEKTSFYKKVSEETLTVFTKHNVELEDALTILLNLVAEICSGFDIDIDPDEAIEFLGNTIEYSKKMKNKEKMK